MHITYHEEIFVNWTAEAQKAVLKVSPRVRESKRVVDSGFHTVDSGFRRLDSGFQAYGFRIPNFL